MTIEELTISPGDSLEEEPKAQCSRPPEALRPLIANRRRVLGTYEEFRLPLVRANAGKPLSESLKPTRSSSRFEQLLPTGNANLERGIPALAHGCQSNASCIFSARRQRDGGTMSLLTRFVNGSIVSSERLMRAREFYAPSRPLTDPTQAFAHWTERASIQSELACSRELAGLTDAELQALEDEFVRCQNRPAPGWIRTASFIGLILLAVGALGLGAQALADLGSREKLAMQLLSMLLVLAGLLPLAATLLYGFKTMHVDVGHGVAGLYVGQLNEQHPWLYKALRLTNHPAGEDYRKRTRDHRGPLRGIDYILMRELVRIEESLEALRPARLVTEEVQLVTPVFDPGPPEPRLVAVPTAVGRFGS